MNYKIFQICFEPRQLNLVQSPLTPFDNTKNEHPELREYHSFTKAMNDEVTKDLDAWGFLGPRWEAKLKYSSEEIKVSIDNNSDNDVWIFNHARAVNALTYNVWEQGEFFHKGLRKVASETLIAAGYNDDVIKAFMTEKNTCYCSYFVARKNFWEDYIDFLSKIISAIDNLSENTKKIYNDSANYSRDNTLNMFPFLIERLFSTFLIIKDGKYKIYFKPYDYSVYKDQVGDFTSVLDALNKMKTTIVKNDSSELFEQWNSIRMHFVKNNSDLFNLD